MVRNKYRKGQHYALFPQTSAKASGQARSQNQGHRHAAAIAVQAHQRAAPKTAYTPNPLANSGADRIAPFLLLASSDSTAAQKSAYIPRSEEIPAGHLYERIPQLMKRTMGNNRYDQKFPENQ